MRILFIQASWVPPPRQLEADHFWVLSGLLEGDVLQPVWITGPEEMEAEFRPNSYPEYTHGRFRYHWFLSWRHSGWRRRLGSIWFSLRKGLEIHRRNPYDCIVVYSHMTPALIGVVLKLLTRAKLVVKIVTSPDLSYLYEHPQRTLHDR